MSGVARLHQAMKLSDFVRNLALRQLKNKKLSPRQIKKELERRWDNARSY